jgi:hypothetical protein
MPPTLSVAKRPSVLIFTVIPSKTSSLTGKILTKTDVLKSRDYTISFIISPFPGAHGLTLGITI